MPAAFLRRNTGLRAPRYHSPSAPRDRTMANVVGMNLRLPRLQWLALKHAVLRESLRRGRPVPASELIREALAAHLAQMERAA